MHMNGVAYRVYLFKLCKSIHVHDVALHEKFAMISAIRGFIDAANSANDEDNGERKSLPPSELVTLGELRWKEYSQRIREDFDLKLLEAEARANVDSAVDHEREFGLPMGEACEDIWGLIFEQVDDVEDIANLRDTCALFRELLQKKYKIMRLVQVALRFANVFGGFNFLLNVRRVCKLSKAAIDRYLSEHELRPDSFEPNSSEQWFPKGESCFFPDPQGLGQRTNELVEKLQVLPNNFPTKMQSLKEVNKEDWNIPLVQLPNLALNPTLPTLWSVFQKILGLIGSSVRGFHYISVLDPLEAYNKLRDMVTLMPNLELLKIDLYMEPTIPGNPELNPFPACPRLKKYVHYSSPAGFSSPFLAQIFHANPWITDVFIYYLWQEEDISTILGVLTPLKLESFRLCCDNVMPPLQVLKLRPKWPLKTLSLSVYVQNPEGQGISSSLLFAFINSFKATLEELEGNWKMRDTGGFLDLPKLTRLRCKLWPEFMTLEFIIALGNLQYLDLNVQALDEINGSLENVKRFVEGHNLSSLFPALKQIRVWRETPGRWLPLWKK